MTTLPNLHKVLWAAFGYRRRGSDDLRTERPSQPTYHGTPFDPDELIRLPDGTTRTLRENAQRRGGPDVYDAELKLSFSASSFIILRGEHAEKCWSAYKGIVYNTK